MEQYDRKLRVLIADDDLDYSKNLKDILDMEGYETCSARSLNQARELLEENSIDVVVLDMVLPDGDGLSLTGKAYETGSGGATQFIIVTGYATLPQAMEAAGRRKILGYEQKPLDIQRFLITLGMARDRIILKEKLRHSEARYRAIVESTSGGMWILDENGIVQFVNNGLCSILGLERDTILGTEAQLYLPQPDAAHQKEPFSDDLRLTTPNGAHTWVQVSTLPISIDPDKTMLLQMFVDISQRKAMESRLLIQTKLLQKKSEEIHAAYQQLRNTNDTISNRLRAPLWRIASLCEYLKKANNGNLSEENRYCLNSLIRQSNEMTELLESILNENRLDMQPERKIAN